MRTVQRCMAMATALWAVVAVARAAETPARMEKLIISAPLGASSMGIDHQRLADTFTRLFDAASKKTGTRVTLDILPSYELQEERGEYGNIVQVKESIKRLKEKKVDIVYMYAEDYFLHDELHGLVRPLTSWSQHKKKYGKACLFAREERGFKKAADLKGTSVNNLKDYVTVRHLLFENGVDQPLTDFFGSFQFTMNPLEALDNLVTGKVDVVYLTWQKWLLAGRQKPEYKQVAPVVCVEEQPLVVLAARKDLAPEELEVFMTVMLNAHRDRDFATLKWFFMAFDGQFFRLDDSYLKGFADMFAQAKKRGWKKEALHWFNTESPKRFKAWLKKQ